MCGDDIAGGSGGGNGGDDDGSSGGDQAEGKNLKSVKTKEYYIQTYEIDANGETFG